MPVKHICNHIKRPNLTSISTLFVQGKYKKLIAIAFKQICQSPATESNDTKIHPPNESHKCFWWTCLLHVEGNDWKYNLQKHGKIEGRSSTTVFTFFGLTVVQFPYLNHEKTYPSQWVNLHLHRILLFSRIVRTQAETSQLWNLEEGGSSIHVPVTHVHVFTTSLPPRTSRKNSNSVFSEQIWPKLPFSVVNKHYIACVHNKTRFTPVNITKTRWIATILNR